MYRWTTTRSVSLALVALTFVVGLLFLARIPQSIADSDAARAETEVTGSEQKEEMQSSEQKGSEQKGMEGAVHKDDDEDENMEREEGAQGSEGTPDSLEDVMKGLLETTQVVLGTLTDEGEAEGVAELAGKLIELGEWAKTMGEDRGAPEAYTLYADTLLRQSRNLRKAAKEGDLETSTLHLGQIQITCVRCHAQVR